MIERADVERALALEDSQIVGHLASELFDACKKGQFVDVNDLISRGADLRYQEEEYGRSPLMVAAAEGCTQAVRALLMNGAPWNAQDKNEQSAGDYARDAEHTDVFSMLLEWACLSEDVLREANAHEKLAKENLDYLQQKLEFSDDKLLDANGEAVMMEWEKPIMIAHANVVCQNGGDILNVGFGMGLVDAAIQEYCPASHTIIEAHPDVHARMLALGWHKRPGVRVLFGRWEDVAPQLGTYNGIFFDTYAEHYDHMRAFHALLPKILKPGGIYSFFNGLAPRCSFFHDVYCRMAARELAALGLATQFLELPVAVDAAQGWDAHWAGVRNRYWFQRTYRLPVVYHEDGDGEMEAGVGAACCAAGTGVEQAS